MDSTRTSSVSHASMSHMRVKSSLMYMSVSMYVRAVDPAGNKDVFFYYGRAGNVYRWKYLSPTAWDIILIVLCSIIGLLLLGFLGNRNVIWRCLLTICLTLTVPLEYQRRVHRAAIERYAMKRLRRKFKALQRDEEEEGKLFDWRALYFESKTDDPFHYKSKKQKEGAVVRDKRKERRERMKKRRGQEKDRIKSAMPSGNQVLAVTAITCSIVVN